MQITWKDHEKNANYIKRSWKKNANFIDGRKMQILSNDLGTNTNFIVKKSWKMQIPLKNYKKILISSKKVSEISKFHLGIAKKMWISSRDYVKNAKFIQGLQKKMLISSEVRE